MEKWADYCISSVKYDSKHTHIVGVKVHEDKGDTVGNAEEWTRIQVVSARERGRTFVTIFKGSDNQWHRGQDVDILIVNREKFIRTDRDQIAADNLEKLPEF